MKMQRVKSKEKNKNSKFYFGLFAFCSLLFILSACGVKNSLEKPNPSFPRTYPVK